MSKVLASHFHIGEIRPGAGIAWVHVNLINGPTIRFYGQREPGNKIRLESIPEAVGVLLAAGHQNLIIEPVVR